MTADSPGTLERVLVYDCFSGISGDMHIGAMLDLGVDENYLRNQLARLGMASEFELIVTRSSKMGISGTQATVRLRSSPHHHRHLQDIRKIIDAAGYPDAVRERAFDIFMHIAVAEAKIHGTSIDEVHFHEVGATDSIADIVAAAVCLDALNIRRSYCSTLELGGGMVRCAHGMMPVPAPATAEILTGVPCRYGGVDSEATTPTGAAILKHAVTAFTSPEGFAIERIGYGLGQKDFAIPNVLRVMLGDIRTTATTEFYLREKNLQIDCNIDDMTPEAYQPLLDALFSAGAKDAFLTPIIMKKSRPGITLSILADPQYEQALLDTVFSHSTSIGVRIHEVDKHMLPREEVTLDTSLGPVSVKRVELRDGRRRWKLEHDQLMSLAELHSIAYPILRKRLQREIETLLGERP